MRRAFRLGLGRGHVEREVDDEIAFHIEMRTQRLVAQGLAPQAAREQALRQFGDVDGVRHDCVTMDTERERAMKRANVLDEVRRDVAYALRTLRRDLGFTAVVVLTLALGIGANTAIFTLINAVLLRTLPVPHPERLVAVGDPSRTGGLSRGTPRTDLLSYPLYRQLREQNRLVTALMASGRSDRLDVLVGAGGEPEHPRGRFVSGNYFSVLGVPAMIGRTFGAEEDGAPGASPVVVISHDYWVKRFGGDPSAVGRTIRIDGTPVTIVGVTPDGFRGEIVGASLDLWMPIGMQPVIAPHRASLDQWKTSWLLLMGRLAPGVTLEQARAGFTTLMRQNLEEYVRTSGDEDAAPALEEEAQVSSGARGFSAVRKSFYVPLLTLMAGVGLLLLIVCANVANLLLARAVARGREMGVRLALGAGRGRLLRQLLTESLVLALLGAAAGLLVAVWGSRLLLTLAADGSRVIPLDLRIDLPVLAFTLLTSLGAVALFGLAPALRASRVDLATAMRSGTRAVGDALGARGQRMPIGRMLIAAQVALSLLLLVGAGLLVRSLRSLQQTNPGLDRDHILMVDVDLASRQYDEARQRVLLREIASRLAQIPGVAGVTFSENGIFSGTESQTTLQVEGFTPTSEEDSLAYFDHVGPGYARAIGAHLLAGRDITAQDDEHAPQVALVNEAFARFYFPSASALGRTMRVDSSTVQIVGVIADTKDHDLRGEPVRRFFASYMHPVAELSGVHFEVRASGEPARLAPAVRRAIAAADPALPVLATDPVSQLMRESLREERLVTRLATGFGVAALLLAGIGLYGVMTYAITRRTGEIGLRVALGAQRRDVIRMVMLDALRVVGLGVVVGVPLAMFAVRLLRSQLYGVGATDPVSYGVALVVLGASAVAAVLLPAMRASRVPPIVALREE